ncbi:unnamed protein product, partial [Durusdinium trenchii]
VLAVALLVAFRSCATAEFKNSDLPQVCRGGFGQTSSCLESFAAQVSQVTGALNASSPASVERQCDLLGVVAGAVVETCFDDKPDCVRTLCGGSFDAFPLIFEDAVTLLGDPNCELEVECDDGDDDPVDDGSNATEKLVRRASIGGGVSGFVLASGLFLWLKFRRPPQTATAVVDLQPADVEAPPQAQVAPAFSYDADDDIAIAKPVQLRCCRLPELRCGMGSFCRVSSCDAGWGRSGLCRRPCELGTADGWRHTPWEELACCCREPTKRQTCPDCQDSTHEGSRKRGGTVVRRMAARTAKRMLALALLVAFRCCDGTSFNESDLPEVCRGGFEQTSSCFESFAAQVTQVSEALNASSPASVERQCDLLGIVAGTVVETCFDDKPDCVQTLCSGSSFDDSLPLLFEDAATLLGNPNCELEVECENGVDGGDGDGANEELLRRASIGGGIVGFTLASGLFLWLKFRNPPQTATVVDPQPADVEAPPEGGQVAPAFSYNADDDITIAKPVL